jgi:hypothetical protein
MLGYFDQPWNFIGEIKLDNKNVPNIECICNKCSKPTFDFKLRENDLMFIHVHLESYIFITDEMLEVIVYFGVCQKCDSIYWARSGLPFRRAKVCIGAKT